MAYNCPFFLICAERIHSICRGTDGWNVVVVVVVGGKAKKGKKEEKEIEHTHAHTKIRNPLKRP